jgi:predicted  nucleic acid-binding Zn-ribbon protein
MALRCTICGIVLGTTEAPAHCPECGARREMFVTTDEEPHGIAHNPMQPHDATEQGPLDIGPGCLDD